MTSENDLELHSLVRDALEKSGYLSSIRAQLRANVFKILDENKSFENEKFSNEKLRKFLECSHGEVVTSLVREFLEYFGLNFTASVFDQEVKHSGNFAFQGRDKLKRQLKLDKTDDGLPLISALSKSWEQKSGKNVSEEKIVRKSDAKKESKKNVLENGSKKEMNFLEELESELGKSDSLSFFGDLPPLDFNAAAGQNGNSSIKNRNKQMGMIKAMLKESVSLDGRGEEALQAQPGLSDDEKEKYRMKITAATAVGTEGDGDNKLRSPIRSNSNGGSASEIDEMVSSNGVDDDFSDNPEDLPPNGMSLNLKSITLRS